MIWTLDSALQLIRNLQPGCEERGWYLALAGGVLNKGHSTGDLDLVAMPKYYRSNMEDLYSYLSKEFGSYPLIQSAVPSANHWSWDVIEVSVVRHAGKN